MVKCPKCHSTNLVLRNIEVRAYEHKINKNGTIAKQRELVEIDNKKPDHIDCKDCQELFYYQLDDNEKLVKLMSY